jgi:hypothetical protein
LARPFIIRASPPHFCMKKKSKKESGGNLVFPTRIFIRGVSVSQS